MYDTCRFIYDLYLYIYDTYTHIYIYIYIWYVYIYIYIFIWYVYIWYVYIYDLNIYIYIYDTYIYIWYVYIYIYLHDTFIYIYIYMIRLYIYICDTYIYIYTFRHVWTNTTEPMAKYFWGSCNWFSGDYWNYTNLGIPIHQVHGMQHQGPKNHSNLSLTITSIESYWNSIWRNSHVVLRVSMKHINMC